MPVNEFDANDPYDWADEYHAFMDDRNPTVSYFEWRDNEKGA